MAKARSLVGLDVHATKIVAAVVKPTTLPRSRRMTPAPRKPIPWTMLEAMRVVLASPVALAISVDKIVKSAAPMQTQRLVRIPAGRLRTLRSMPMTDPSSAAQSTLSRFEGRSVVDSR